MMGKYSERLDRKELSTLVMRQDGNPILIITDDRIIEFKDGGQYISQIDSYEAGIEKEFGGYGFCGRVDIGGEHNIQIYTKKPYSPKELEEMRKKESQPDDDIPF